MSSNDIQKLRDAHEAIKHDLRKLAGTEQYRDLANGHITELRATLSRMTSQPHLLLIGAITGVAFAGIGYVALQASRQEPSEKWVAKIQHQSGSAGRNP